MASRMNGFTLVELAATVTVLATLLMVGLPRLLQLVDRTRTAATFHELRADMALARSAALMRRTQVVVCPRDGQQARCRLNGDWGDGWLVFIDPDRDRQPGSDRDLLSLRPASASGRARLALASNRAHLRYQAAGRAAAANHTLQACARGRFMGKLVVNNVGRVRSERPRAAAACPFRAGDGRAADSP